ncbi:hypothetical protein SASPL_130693 [Salvia splendens]|uniref:C2 domain-containing protein n=1 Tax=Salvia splendens TaxID=180675 RepID=A0A8X8ZK65_SALSN|nr:hypothetical protein SASPL_130693 [Salvia splendens]
MDGLGLLRIRVERGMNLAVPDTRTSDPYVVIECASQSVYDHDTLSGDDSMGSAKIDIKRLVECVEMGPRDLPTWQSGGEQRELFVEGELHRVEEREESLADDIDAHESVQSRQIHYDDILSDQLLNRDPIGDDEEKDVIHSSVEGSFTLGDVEASMELVVKEVDSGFGRNGSDTKWKYADNTDEHRAVGINICSTTLDTDARLIPPRIDTTCLGIPGCVDWLHFWMPDNHKAEQCLWNKTACKDHEPNLVERLDGSVEVSGVTDVKVSESKDGGQVKGEIFTNLRGLVMHSPLIGGFWREDHSNENELFLVQDFFGYTEDVVTEEISVGQVASGDADSGKSYERIGGYGGPPGFFRGGFSNGDGEGDRPHRHLDRRSIIGCDYESKREEAGCGTWGTRTNEYDHVVDYLDFYPLLYLVASNLNVFQEAECVKHEVKTIFLLESFQATTPLVLVLCEKKEEMDDIHEDFQLKSYL